ncbi:MAG: quinol:cytochrome C oxidoreductase, partial [Planctomycetes bacterium]|nr:quinol:cytochrome C oxidoreductase [Planctomycetota bacterium]
DIGKFMFGFVMFWSYIAFSQLLLIWYGNIPEETYWYKVRLENGWQFYSYSLIFVHFAIPLLGLMSRHVRRHRSGLFFWACWLILVHWMDMAFLVMPNVQGGFPVVPMVGHFLGGLGMLFLLAAFFIFRASGTPLVAVRDPRLPEALTYTNPIL